MRYTNFQKGKQYIQRHPLERIEFGYSMFEKERGTIRSYYIESVGHISEATIRKYIEDQKEV